MKLVHWADPLGKEHVWESLERTNHRKAPVDAVEIIAVLKRAGQPNHLILVRQFRPPTGQYCLELPAGLCDTGEKPEVTALRELREETGYTGHVLNASPSVMFGVAVASTTSGIVTVTIDGDAQENRNVTPVNDEGEFTEVFLAPIPTLLQFLEDRAKEGDGIDGKLWLLAYTLLNGEAILK
jgi:8-oxo-dGTP pyrophosphatase MutT (NUDIX family)